MIKFRVNTQNGYTEFLEKNAECLAFHAQHGVGEIEEIEMEEPGWNKQGYFNEVNNAHTALFQRMYTERNYSELADVNSWAKIEIAPYENNIERKQFYKAEALALLKWWIDTYLMFEDHMAVVTEATADVEAFIQSLPEFTI